MKITTPVLFLIFNRPDTTQQVFNEIRKARPAKLFVAADGPRENREGEAEKCEAARDIIKQVDWDCELKKLFRDKNLGCKVAVSSAIDWLFENVEEGIILEDDCLPSQSFFRFCQELLEYYRNDTRMMHVSGDNFQFGIQRGNASYYFSKYNLIWGWATWKRAWEYFDVEMKTFDQFRIDNQIRNIFRTRKGQKYWMNIYQAVYDGKIDSWGYPWLYSRIIAGGISIHPNVNLIQNIGFGPDSTHTKGADIRIINNLPKEIEFPLKHPRFVLTNENADQFVFDNMLCRSILTKLKIRIRKFRHERDIRLFLFNR